MRLATDTILHAVARTLREQVSPATDDAFVRDVLRMAASQVEVAAHAWDDAAALRVAENARLRALFGDAAAMVATGTAMAAELAAAARSADPGLRIGELDAENGRLRDILVRLHSQVETWPGADAAALDRRIWALLGDIERARAPRS